MAARILIIEDNSANLDLMRYLLAAFGYEVETVATGEDGVRMIRDSCPDLVICDLQLPVMDGYEVVRICKGDGSLKTIPFVAVTAYAMVGDHDKVRNAGFDGYITKPIDPERFVSQIEAFIHPGKRSRTAPVPHEIMPAPIRPAGDGKTILVLDDMITNVELARSLLEPLGYRVISAATISNALSLARKERPDLIISDVHLHEEDGFQFLEEIRKDPLFASIPFFFLSSSSTTRYELAQKLEEEGVKVILRPIEAPELVAKIEETLGNRGR